MTFRTIRAALIFILFVLSATPLSAQTTTEYLVSWAPNPESDIAGYIIYRSLEPDTGFEAVDSVSADTYSWLDSSASRGVTYYYRIVAKNERGDRSPFSNLVSGFTIPQDATKRRWDL